MTVHLLKIPGNTHRGFLALDAGAVEAQCRHAVRLALDAEDALVVPLSGLRLRKVPSGQRDGLGNADGNVYRRGRQNLGAILQNNKSNPLFMNR